MNVSLYLHLFINTKKASYVVSLSRSKKTSYLEAAWLALMAQTDYLQEEAPICTKSNKTQ